MQSIKRIFSSVVAISTILSLTSVPAWAEGLTGIYEGTRQCAFYDGTRGRGRIPGVMGVTQTQDGDVFLHLIGDGLDEHYEGFFFPDDTRDNRAGAAFIGCDQNSGLFTDAIETVAAEAIAKRNGGITFKAQSTLIFSVDNPPDNDRGWLTCRWNFKRVDDSDPGVGPCP